MIRILQQLVVKFGMLLVNGNFNYLLIIRYSYCLGGQAVPGDRRE